VVSRRSPIHPIALLSPEPDFVLVVKSGIRNTAKNARTMSSSTRRSNNAVPISRHLSRSPAPGFSRKS